MLKGEVVRGLTTAASVWAVAAIGLAAGGGLFYAATISTVIILVILAGLKPLEEVYRARAQACTIELRAERGAVPPDEIKKLLKLPASRIRQVVVGETDNAGIRTISIRLTRVSDGDIRRGVANLQQRPGVAAVEVTQRHRYEEAQPS